MSNAGFGRLRGSASVDIIARPGFCARRFCHTGLRAGIQFFWLPEPAFARGYGGQANPA